MVGLLSYGTGTRFRGGYSLDPSSMMMYITTPAVPHFSIGPGVIDFILSIIVVGAFPGCAVPGVIGFP
jgi:hypothetical protein